MMGILASQRSRLMLALAPPAIEPCRGHLMCNFLRPGPWEQVTVSTEILRMGIAAVADTVVL